MTREELSARVAYILRDERSGRCLRDGCNCYRQVIGHLAEERDVALGALRVEEKKTYAANRETHAASLQRDRALALLRRVLDLARDGWENAAHYTDNDGVANAASEALDRVRALLAEVGE